MNRINLLPHREMRRERRKKDFVGLCGMIVAAGVATALLVGFGINSQIDSQNERNAFIASRNGELDSQIKEIGNLEKDIQSLLARQEAVETLQSNRTVPVHLFDELVKYVPEGVYLTSLKQVNNVVTLMGQAQTNERIADFLRNLASEMKWLEKPELTRIQLKTTTAGRAIRTGINNGQGEAPRQLFEFQLNAILKSTTDGEPETAKKKTASRVANWQVAAK